MHSLSSSSISSLLLWTVNSLPSLCISSAPGSLSLTPTLEVFCEDKHIQCRCTCISIYSFYVCRESTCMLYLWFLWRIVRWYWRCLLYKYNIAHDDDKERKCVLTSVRSKLQGGTGGGVSSFWGKVKLYTRSLFILACVIFLHPSLDNKRNALFARDRTG